MSYIKGPTQKLLKSISLGSAFEEVMKLHKNKIFINSKHENKNLTIGELIQEADNLATGLCDIGLKIGDKIGIICHNSIQAFVTNVGCFRGGFVAVNLNPALQQRELEFCINKVGITCLISIDRYKEFSVLNTLKKVVPEVDHCRSRKLESIKVPSLNYIVIMSRNNYTGTYNYENIKTLGSNRSNYSIRNNLDKINCNDVCIINFTSGTTGLPKAAALTHYQLYNNCIFVQYRLAFDKKKYKMCFFLPLFHLLGITCMLLSLFSGATIVLPSYYYNPEQNLKTIMEERCTFLMGSPTMYSDLIHVQKKEQLPISVEFALSGGSMCSKNIFTDMKEILKIKNVGNGYGSSEGMAIMFPSLNNLKMSTVTSLYNIMDHLEAKIVDSTGNIVPLGTEGELCIKGYSVIDNYYNENVKSNVFLDDGWFRTGDVLYLDENKTPHIVGRLKEIINRGGEKISPMEIEEILETHPNISKVCVIGTPHERLGEEVCACIIPKEGSIITLFDIRDYCKGKVAYFKIPSRLEIVGYFPQTNMGKIQRSQLRDLIIETALIRNG